MLITTSEVDISILVSGHNLPDALSVVRDYYGLEPEKNRF